MCDVEKLRAAGCEGITAVTEDGEILTVETLYGAQTVARQDALLDRCTVLQEPKACGVRRAASAKRAR